MIKAINYAKSFNYDFMWVECDSTVVVQVIQKRDMHDPWGLYAAWSNCLQFLEFIAFCMSQYEGIWLLNLF